MKNLIITAILGFFSTAVLFTDDSTTVEAITTEKGEIYKVTANYSTCYAGLDFVLGVVMDYAEEAIGDVCEFPRLTSISSKGKSHSVTNCTYADVVAVYSCDTVLF